MKKTHLKKRRGKRTKKDSNNEYKPMFHPISIQIIK